MRRLILVFLAIPFMTGATWADKIIMKDGKIYEGHIMGETSTSLLISNPPIDPKPRFLELKDVLTIVRESRPPEKPSPEDGRFASVSMGVTLEKFSSDTFSFSPTAGLGAGGAFRMHPAVEVGGEFHWVPELRGPLSITDGTHLRGYEHFTAYDGGFSTKLFPFFWKKEWRAEPYLTTGYHWSRLIPKGSGDTLKGDSIFGGAGVLLPWRRPLYWDFRFTYAHTHYSSVTFLNGNGELSGVNQDTFGLSAGLSYRFL